MDILKNPIILAVIAAILVYGYLYWDEKKRLKKNPKSKPKNISILTPGVAGIIVWFIASSYTSDTKPVITTNPIIKNLPELPLSVIEGGSGNNNNNLKPLKPQLLDNNVNLPPVDVFIDLAKLY